LIVSTFGWSTLDSILFQFPLGGICLIAILLTGFLGSRFPNIRIIMLIVCCLPVIAGCAMIWKCEWSYHAAGPVVGYSIIGTFGGVVSLIITIGMSNIAGHTKKSFMAATIFVAYCVGNIIGPNLVRSQTKAQHYPELWTGLIIWYGCILYKSTCLKTDKPVAIVSLSPPPWLCMLSCIAPTETRSLLRRTSLKVQNLLFWI